MGLKFWNRKESVTIVTIDSVKDCLKSRYGFKQDKIDKLIEYGLDSKIESYIKTYDLTSVRCAGWIVDWVEESYLLDI